MDWIDIKDFYYSKASMKKPEEITVNTSAYGVKAEGIIILKKLRTKTTVKKDTLLYRTYNSINDVTENIMQLVEDGSYILKEYKDNSVAVFSLKKTPFKNVLAYMLESDMINFYYGD